MSTVDVTVSYSVDGLLEDTQSGHFSVTREYRGGWSIWGAFDEASARFKADVDYQTQGVETRSVPVTIGDIRHRLPEGHPLRAKADSEIYGYRVESAERPEGPVNEVAFLKAALAAEREGRLATEELLNSVIDAQSQEAAKLQGALATSQDQLAEARALIQDLHDQGEQVIQNWGYEREFLIDERDALLAQIGDLQAAIEGLNSVADKYI